MLMPGVAFGQFRVQTTVQHRMVLGDEFVHFSLRPLTSSSLGESLVEQEVRTPTQLCIPQLLPGP